jgi:DNA replication protein DnaC
VGKTMIAQALGYAACRHGYSAAFTKTSRLVGDLAGGHADRSWETRLKAWTRPNVLILDDFAMREFTPSQPTTSTIMPTPRLCRLCLGS